MSKKAKTILIILMVILAVVFVVIMRGNSSAQKKSTTGLSSSVTVPLPGAPTSEIGNDEFSALLSRISRITINTALFKNPAYMTLRDYPVVLGTDLVGRTNPFAPIGSDGPIQVPGSTAVSIQTLQPAKITSTTAELGAQITLPNIVPTSVIFEYGPSDMFGSVSTPVIATKSGAVLTTITQLVPETTYYVRAIAVRGAETTTAQTMTFITPKASTRR